MILSSASWTDFYNNFVSLTTLSINNVSPAQYNYTLVKNLVNTLAFDLTLDYLISPLLT